MSNNNFNSFNNKKTGVHPINIAILVIVVVAVVVLGYFSLSDKKSDSSQDSTNNVRHNTSLYSSDAYSTAQVAHDKDALDSIMKIISAYKPNNLNSVLEIIAEVNKFKSLSEDVHFFSQKYSTDTSFTNKIHKMLDAMKQKQNNYFPYFREAYCKVANKIMGEGGISSRISGANNNVLELLGDRYLDTANIKVDYGILSPHLELLRYKQIIFKGKGENTITKTYTINSINDDSIQ